MTVAPFTMAAATLRPLLRLRRQWNFDLIDAHYFYPDGVAAVLLGMALRKPVVITARGTDLNLLPGFAVPKRLIQFAARRATGIVAVSHALKTALEELGVPGERVVVLRNGVDLKLFHPTDRAQVRTELGMDGRTLLSVGHLIERKGHHVVISALPRLQAFSLVIVGDGSERDGLVALSRKLGVSDRVRFVGGVPHEMLFRYYGAADALVLASSREGWPNVLLEAMACGTPVVATPVWGNPEIVSSAAAGLLMRDRSPEALADAVEALFRSLPDRGATRAFAEGFSWDATSDGQRRLFARILAGRRGSAE
jgi:glycosyltransferase involved in cell wall biosynthesis